MFSFVILFCLIFALNLCCASVINGSNLKDEGIKFGGLRHDRSTFLSNDPNVNNYIEHAQAQFMVAINVVHDLFKKDCSGAFITAKFHVLTNAHCVHDGQKKVPVKCIKIRYGSRYVNQYGKTIGVALVSIHPKYSEPYNDVAVLTPKGNIDKTIAINLPRGDPETVARSLNELIEVNGVATIYGYGIKPSRGYEEERLMGVDIPFRRYAQCRNDFSYIPDFDKFLGNRFCVFSKEQNPCEGDGGAILTQSTIPGVVGLFSEGKHCGETNRPALFTNITDATSFIDSAIKAIGEKSRSYSFEPGLGPIYGFLLILGMRFTITDTR